ncbi:hypothetical protein CPLU01_01539 [Colletotrichum plurivorum]|uniref:Uncharacterized protein n=1 Tax=Colletotrichum plurivorum TaxID=2175906 RepID=A0A8H6NP36_9PEZI|nr:hypothetical protein CPLU01_01539 [Colletotrichum plurivorum]
MSGVELEAAQKRQAVPAQSSVVEQYSRLTLSRPRPASPQRGRLPLAKTNTITPAPHLSCSKTPSDAERVPMRDIAPALPWEFGPRARRWLTCTQLDSHRLPPAMLTL